MKDQEKDKEATERRDFLKKVGIGGASALVGGAILGSQSASASTKGAESAPRTGIFLEKTFSSHLRPEAEASSKFSIDLRDFTLDDAALSAVRNAIVAAAVDQVKRLGKPTPLNHSANLSTFSSFSSFGSFGSFGQGPIPIDNAS